MPTKQDMLDKIYEVIADKTISNGCKYTFWWDIFQVCLHSVESCKKSLWDIKIIWHPVMIWDVLDWFYMNIELPIRDWRETCDIILLERNIKRKPIEKQSDECIEYVYNLCK